MCTHCHKGSLLTEAQVERVKQVIGRDSFLILVSDGRRGEGGLVGTEVGTEQMIHTMKALFTLLTEAYHISPHLLIHQLIDH